MTTNCIVDVSKDVKYERIIDQKYAYWRKVVLSLLIAGYASFYIIRQNLQVVCPALQSEFGCTKSEIGWVFTWSSLIYGCGKFIGGVICDKTKVKYFMAIGLAGTSLCSLFSGFSSSLFTIVAFYLMGSIFQSTGWPPVPKLMTHWYSPKDLGTKWGIVSLSHKIGSISILVGGSWLLDISGWRSVFIVSGLLSLAVACLLFWKLCDTPESMGLPSVEEKEGLPRQMGHRKGEDVTLKEIFFEHILPNRTLWYVCFANFFVYIIRMGFFNWAPMFLQEARGASVSMSGWQAAGFEVAGAISGIFAGWLSDKMFKGRRNQACFYFMLALIVVLLIFWKLSVISQFVNMAFLFIMGFLIYGPQTLAGLSGAEFGSKRAAAAANGLTGTFGALGHAVSGIGVAWIVDVWGWNATMVFFALCALGGMLFFILNWNSTARKHS
ncbi:MAG: MFS transporter [Puniceicoccales bacterium]|jgi:OPA family glycerol-3-phosphate transporter-like MFS transporter|nr:MFS transporter [Puniceicoccales bacterium]